MRTWLKATVAAAVVALAVAGAAFASPHSHSHGSSPWHSHEHKAHQGKLPPIDVSNAANCDFIAEPGNPVCMLPFPDDYYTVADPSSPTGRRVHFTTEGMPKNALETPINPEPYDASDGFSPGSVIVLKVPGLETAADVSATGAVPINHIGRYRKGNAPVVVIDAATGKRWPIWVEIDSTAADPSKAALEIHPAVNFASGHRYIVALRHLRNAAGEPIEAPAAFRYYRDKVPSKQPEINARRGHFEAIFKRLQMSGIHRSDLYLAWDFTVTSDQNNAGRELAMRNAAFAQLGDTNLADGVPQGASPSFEVTSVQNEPNPGEIARRVKGTLQVPCYLFPNCGPGGTMHLDESGAPIQNGTWTANFDCIIPIGHERPGRDRATLALWPRPVRQRCRGGVEPQRSLSQAHGIVQCATDEIGMSAFDVPVAIGALQNLSLFPAIPDRLQQGLLDELYLGRAMISPSGFTTNPVFHQDGTTGTDSVLDTSHLYYNGNSQGGIMGGALTAVAPDFTRASLGVPAMNYSVLLPRSVDFDPFAAILYPSYPDETARPLILDLMQMLWDRGEPNGYANRMTGDPLPGTPAHQVLLDVAFGDHQVTDFQADVEARTVGAAAHRPVLFPGRWPGTDVFWNVPSIHHYPYPGSAIYYWDIGPVREGPLGETIGVEPPPYENLPNRSGEDPHGAPRAAPAEQQLVSDFFAGAIQLGDNCGSGPCYAGSFTGP